MIEIVIITLLVLWSCLIVLKKLMPNTANRIFSKISDLCRQQGWHKVSVWLQPKKNIGCGGGCGCDANDDSPQKIQEIKTVKWK